MGKKKMTLSNLLILAVIFCTGLFFNGLWGQGLVWEDPGSFEQVILPDNRHPSELLPIDSNFSIAYSQETTVNDTNVFFVIDVGCFGIPCYYFLVFAEIENSWKLVAMTNFKQTNKDPSFRTSVINHINKRILSQDPEILIIREDKEHRKIILEIDSGVIGELSFDVLQ